MNRLYGSNLTENPDDKSLRGSLSMTTLTDLLQFLASSDKSGAIRIVRDVDNVEGMIYFSKGEILSARCGEDTGIESFAKMLNWKQGDFHFLPGISPLDTTIGLSVQHAILEAVVLQENQTNDTATTTDNTVTEPKSTPKAATSAPSAPKPNTSTPKREPEIVEGSSEMDQEARESTFVMNDLLGISGIDAVVVVGRDGFVIESAGSSARINLDELGASLAHAINGIEEMGSELNISVFQDMFIEYGQAVIMCKPIGDAVAAIVTPDASKLGIIRHKTKKLFQELGMSF